MFGRAIALFLSAAFPALSAAAPAPASTTGDTQSQQAPQPLYKSIWREDKRGNVAHLQSGLVCDAQSAGFQRTHVTAFKADGLDVSCNYMDAAHSDVTLYMTRRTGETLDADMAEAERQMLSVYPDASNLPAPAADPAGIAKSAFYARDGGQIREGIWIADLSGWTLEYRGTWKAASEAATLSEIATLTDMAVRTAGAQLGLCTKSAPPTRDGTALTDKDEIQQTLIMASIMMGGAAMSPKKEEEVPRTWCAESVVGQGEDSYLLWHAVYADGRDAEADKLTGFTVEEPSPLMSEADALTNAVLAETGKGQSAKPRWTVTHAGDKGTWIYGFYDGRPAASDLAKTASDLDHGRARALGGFDPKTKQITIVTDK